MTISVSQKQGRVPVAVIGLDGRLDGKNYQELIAKGQELWLSRTFRESRLNSPANRWRSGITYKILLPRHKRGSVFGSASRFLRPTSYPG